MDISSHRQQLASVLGKLPSLAIAVSGGVDSLTLAAFANTVFSVKKAAGLTLYHAVSPAVPVDATRRLERLAAERGWPLVLVNAGELDDENYRSNPVNRCYFCKQNLYAEIRKQVSGTIASGTNLDDLADFRPGLKAAEEARIIHPFVETGFTKALIRILAAELGLSEVAELPASPCLSSRVRTGIGIDSELLQLIDRSENILRQSFPDHSDVRCRVHENHLVMQLLPFDCEENSMVQAENRIRECFASSSYSRLADHIKWSVYLQGSAFVQTVNPVRTTVHG